MRTQLSLFPKSLAALSVPALAALVRATGLDTCNAVLRKGYWTDPDKLAHDLPEFTTAMRGEGVEISFTETDWDPAQLLALPKVEETLQLLHGCGIRDIRLRQTNSGGKFGGVGDVRQELSELARAFAKLSALAERHPVRFIYQVHHKTLISSPSALWPLLRDLPPTHIGAMLDAGNQAIEGYEDWLKSARLLGSHLVAFGVKDLGYTRDPAQAAADTKGWRTEFRPITEGVTNWRQVVAALRDIDFHGTLVFMPFYREGATAATLFPLLQREVSYLRTMLAPSS
jgi:sugar phosphate isomerase/epimerase